MLTNKTALLSSVLVTAIITGCDDIDNKSHKKHGDKKDNTEMIDKPDSTKGTAQTFEVSLTNLTFNQPLSPPVVILHDKGYSAFTEGEPASVGLEALAEGGSTSQLINEISAYSGTISYTKGSMIQPGQSITVNVGTDLANPKLTVVSMLENTNDAFTGIGSFDLSNTSMTINGPVWDSGTEVNDERASTIPGPVAGGQGFNSERVEAPNVVTFHQGVITQAGGLADSVLNESHRFDQPAIKITIIKK
ncbi:MAG: spondin domain-containing protein [Cellvibrionales bacterium]|nr:spondin domain-containing protein [Cellvibrionales bacterium]